MIRLRTGFAIFLCLFLMSIPLKRVCAERTVPPAVIENHIKKMKRLYPERFSAIEKSAGGNVLDCLGCHKITGNKKSHSHFQVPDTRGNTGR